MLSREGNPKYFCCCNHNLQRANRFWHTLSQTIQGDYGLCCKINITQFSINSFCFQSLKTYLWNMVQKWKLVSRLKVTKSYAWDSPELCNHYRLCHNHTYTTHIPKLLERVLRKGALSSLKLWAHNRTIKPTFQKLTWRADRATALQRHMRG